MADHGFVPSPPHGGPNSTTRTTAASGRGPSRIVVRPWVDPTIDRRGHDLRSRYVERFWLGVLGPSATWLARRLVDEVEVAGPAGTSVDLSAIAASMGMSYSPGTASAFARAVQRCVMFGVAHHTGDGLAVRRRLPDVAERHLRRLPPAVSIEHDRWADDRRNGADDVVGRARRLARAMSELGDERERCENQLVRLGIDAGVAARVLDELTRDAAAAV